MSWFPLGGLLYGVIFLAADLMHGLGLRIFWPCQRHGRVRNMTLSIPCSTATQSMWILNRTLRVKDLLFCCCASSFLKRRAWCLASKELRRQAQASPKPWGSKRPKRPRPRLHALFQPETSGTGTGVPWVASNKPIESQNHLCKRCAAYGFVAAQGVLPIFPAFQVGFWLLLFFFRGLWLSDVSTGPS